MNILLGVVALLSVIYYGTVSYTHLGTGAGGNKDTQKSSGPKAGGEAVGGVPLLLHGENSGDPFGRASRLWERCLYNRIYQRICEGGGEAYKRK